MININDFYRFAKYSVIIPIQHTRTSFACSYSAELFDLFAEYKPNVKHLSH